MEMVADFIPELIDNVVPMATVKVIPDLKPRMRLAQQPANEGQMTSALGPPLLWYRSASTAHPGLHLGVITRLTP